MGRILRKVEGAADIVRATRRGRESLEGIDVLGHLEFRRAVTRALRLLRDHELSSWRVLETHVNTIVEGRKTIAIVTARPAFMFISLQNSRQAPEHLAGTIAALACSCQVHRDCEAENPGRPVPRERYAGDAARELCDREYRRVVLALGKEPTPR